MAKAKRMSDIFASSSGKDDTILTATATPPYSSEGPTLPLLDANAENNNMNETAPQFAEKQDGHNTITAAPTTTVHPSLYEPWKLLPLELLKLLESQNRLRATQNIIPVVFTKNQNVKSGINRLKLYLGAYQDKTNSTITIPDTLDQRDALIAISAQGDGAAKLVSIVEMAKRIVEPKSNKAGGGGNEKGTEVWYSYTSLTSVEDSRKRNHSTKREDVNAAFGLEEKGDAEDVELMDVDKAGQDEKKAVTAQSLRVPVLTVWMTRERISAFRDAFGEQSFVVQKVEREEN